LVQHIKRVSDDLLQIEEGSLYAAFERLLRAELVKAEWACPRQTGECGFRN
jgi:PadR family transcriptional regulator PadR